MSIWKGKAVAIYYLVVSGIAFFPVREIYLASTHIDIALTFANCGASYLTGGLLWLSMATLSVLLHMVIGYFYYSANREGPYGPLAVVGQRKKPPRKRILPYVANLAVLASIGFAGAMTYPRCRAPSESSLRLGIDGGLSSNQGLGGPHSRL